MPIRLTQYDAAEGAVDLGELWALANDGHGLRLVVRTHPKGWQLCLCRDGEVMRLDDVRHKARVVFLAARWLANAEKAGWTRLRADTIADPLDAERDRPRAGARDPRAPMRRPIVVDALTRPAVAENPTPLITQPSIGPLTLERFQPLA